MARFSDSKNPKLTVMIQGNTADEVISVIKKTIPQGAEAFCILTESLDPHDKSKESIKRIIDAAEGMDTYMTNYIRSNSQPELSDDRLAEQLLALVSIELREEVALSSVFAVGLEVEILFSILLADRSLELGRSLARRKYSLDAIEHRHEARSYNEIRVGVRVR